MLIIQANNIHESGARYLLLSILKSICAPESNLQATVFLDQRFDRTLLEGLIDDERVAIRGVTATVGSRLRSEWAISRLAAKHSGSTLLCLGSIPPLFPCAAEVILYYQTVLYFKAFRKYIGGLRSFVKLSVEGFWIRARIDRVDRIFVQSRLVKDLLCKEFSLDGDSISVMPFADLENLKAVSSPVDANSRKGFFYPALGTPHKNHVLLIDAWVILAKQEIYPLLLLTIDPRFEQLLTHLEQARSISGIRAVNLGLLSHQQVLDQLLASEAMIFPSLCESFGLPLLEARENGLPVIACERDYVREILDPVETFDPESALSIARAVKRFLGIQEQHLAVLSPETLIKSIAGKGSAAR
ncbi:MAG: glycosyltransferase [Sulfuritalea sp.]|nr:glycosyltransferase [Sulfuritalea sp.]